MDAKTRKQHPLYSGLIKYFPDACMAVANCSYVGNEQHNPGQPMHWAREKSKDHGDCILRHQMDAGIVDSDGIRHATKVAWRALAQLQLELEGAREAQGSPVSAVPDLEPFRFRCATIAEDGTTKTPKDKRRGAKSVFMSTPRGRAGIDSRLFDMTLSAEGMEWTIEGVKFT